MTRSRRARSGLVWSAALACALGLGVPAAAESAEGDREVVINVNGMFCPFCTFGIQKRLRALEEAAAVRTDLAAGEAIVTLRPGAEFVPAHFGNALERAGFSYSAITLRGPGAAVSADGGAAAGAPDWPPASAPTSMPASAPSTQPASRPTSAPMAAVQSRPLAVAHVVGGRGTEPGRFQGPMSIAFSPEGFFVVADTGNRRIQQFSSADLRPIRQWTVAGDGVAQLRQPVGIAVDAEGDIWVTDYQADTLHRYGPDGRPKGVLGKTGSEPGAFDAPSGIAVGPDGALLVTEFFNHRVQVLRPDGAVVRTFGREGHGPGELFYPTRIAAGADGTVYVGDAYNYRVAVFRGDGTFVRSFGTHGSGPGQFNVSAGTALLPDSRIAVADFLNHRIQVFAQPDQFMFAFGTHGSAPGQFERPTDVAVAPDGTVFVVDWGNDRVQVFDLARAR